MRPLPHLSGSTGGVGAALLLLVAACKSPEEYKQSADDSVYPLVAARRAEIGARVYVDDDVPFTVDPADNSLRGRILSGESDLGVLDIPQLLELAAEQSREYLLQREALYLAALDLTLEADEFTNRYFGGTDQSLSGNGHESALAQGNPFFGLTRFVETGASFAFNAGLRFFRDLSTGDSWTAISDLGFNFTQPLMRGAGKRIAREPLTQAERNVVYASREYERFRRTFAFDVVNRAFRILQQNNIIANERFNLKSLHDLRIRNEALAEAGRLSDIQADQAYQDELRSENALVVEEAALKTLYDDFKLFLGLPMEAQIVVDELAFDRLSVESSAWVDLGQELISQIALERRLDFQTTQDRFDDAERRVYIAADALRAGLNLEGGALLSSEDDKPLKYDLNDLNWQLGLDLDLPLERTAERNAYRAALIVAQRAKRNVEQQHDSIHRDLRDELRAVRATRQTYEIQVASVRLAERRTESAGLSFDAGRATTRDLLEAQESLLDAQNGEARALVNHYLSLLALYRDMEVLVVDETGVTVDRGALEILNGLTP